MDKRQIKWLETQLIKCAILIDDKSSPVITVGARREACLVHLQLWGYNFDHEKRRVYKSVEGKRAYID